MNSKTIKLHDLIETVYDAALDPSEWDDLIHKMQSYFSSHMAGLFIQDTVNDKLVSSYIHGISEEHVNSYDQYFASVNPWFSEQGWMRTGRILTDQSIDVRFKNTRQYINTEYYNDWAKQQDFRHAMGGMLSTENNISINFTLFRSQTAGHYTKQEIQDYKQLSQHLIKSVTISKKLQHQKLLLNASSNWVDKLQFGVIMLDNQGKLVHSNQYANNIITQQDGLSLKNNQLQAIHAQQDDNLQKIIHQHLNQKCTTPRDEQNSISISRNSDNLAYSLIVLKLQNTKHNKFNLFEFGLNKPAIIVFINDPQQKVDIENNYLINKYSLTNTETRLVINLIHGQSLKQAAISCNLKYETARWYLKSIFEKTQSQSQPDLIRTILTDVATQIYI